MSGTDTLRSAVPAADASAATGAPPATGVPDPGGRPAAPTSANRRSRRWLRLVTPFGVVLLVLIISAIAYSVQQPDVTDRAYLSPRGTAGIGGSRLAGLLARRGVTVQREVRSSDALVAAYRGNATLFVPTPALTHPFYLRMLKLLPASTHVVLVSPGQRTVIAGRLPAPVADERIAARAVPPGCAFAPARAAGSAGIGRLRYGALFDDGATELARCYHGSLVSYRRGTSEEPTADVTLIGADDVFRNDRIEEHRNADLAIGLLSRSPRMIWLDLHRSERRPGVVDDPALASAPPAPPSLGPGSPDPDFPVPSGTEDGGDPQAGSGTGDGGEGGGNPLWRAFPAWAFTAVAAIAIAALLFALARGRRLAAPIPEPLPVAVRATETVEGRGRLYQRAKARSTTLAALQRAARTRLARLLDLPAEVPPPTLVPAVANAAGWAPEQVTSVLYPPDPPDPDQPSDDRALVRAAIALDTLMQAVTHQAPPDAVPEGEFR